LLHEKVIHPSLHGGNYFGHVLNILNGGKIM
jgi:hypothetical protein